MGQSSDKDGVKWNVIETGEINPKVRYAPTCNIIPHTNKAIFIGGEEALDDFFIFDLVTNKWVKKEAPVGIRHHSSCVFSTNSKTFLVLFGGIDKGGSYLSDVWEIAITNAEDISWEKIETKGLSKPIGRHCHSGTLHPDGDSMFVFGGQTDGKFLNDLWKYNPKSRTWELIQESDEATMWTDQVVSSDVRPSPRYSHTAVTIKKTRKMLVTCGQTSNGKFGEFWEYSFEKNHWNKLIFENIDRFIPRSYHRAIILRDNNNNESSVFIGTGYYEYETKLEKYAHEEFVYPWRIDLSTNRLELVKVENLEYIMWGYELLQYKNKIFHFGGREKTLLKQTKIKSDDYFGQLPFHEFKKTGCYVVPDRYYFVRDLDMLERVEFLVHDYFQRIEEKVVMVKITGCSDEFFVTKSLLM